MLIEKKMFTHKQGTEKRNKKQHREKTVFANRYLGTWAGV